MVQANIALKMLPKNAAEFAKTLAKMSGQKAIDRFSMAQRIRVYGAATGIQGTEAAARDLMVGNKNSEALQEWIKKAIATQEEVDKAIGKEFNQIYDRIEGSNPFAKDQNLINSAKDSLTNPLGKSFLQDLYARGDEFINPYASQAKAGFDKASSLVSNPMQHSGYQLADTASRGLQNLYTDPMSNPLMQAVSNITSENAARRSAAGRGLNAGSMPAEMQDALLAALSQNYSNIANPMNQSVSSGSNWYQGDVTGATNLGSSASAANAQAAQSLAALAGAGASGMNASANLANAGQQAVNAHLPAMRDMTGNQIDSSILTNPTRANIADAGQQGGSSTVLDQFGRAVTNKVAQSATNKVLDWIWS